MDQLSTPFGTAPNGENILLITLSNDVLSIQISTFGATIRSLYAPDRNGKPTDVVLGYDDPDSYISQDGYLGATVGRYANRIAGGRFVLNGQCYTLPTNNGANHLHGGLVGFSHRVWKIEAQDADLVTLALDSPDGEQGYPGNMKAQVCFALEGSALSIRYRATTDRDTVCNLTNHSYFNLAGHDSGSILAQEIQLNAQYYTPSNAELIPLGTVEPVKNTPMDLRRPVPIGAHINDASPQLVQAGGYDHNWVLDGEVGKLHPAAWAYSPTNGIVMQMETTLPGVHFYTGNFLNRGLTGKSGSTYGPRHGFCLETQFFPDSPNQPTFPSAVLNAGSTYDHTTVFRFSSR